jgi:hypothetical protein
MSLSLAIALIIVADIALLAGLAFVMSRAALLTPHVPSDPRDNPGPRAITRRRVRRAAPDRPRRSNVPAASHQ